MAKYLDNNGLLYFWQKIKATFATQSDFDDLSDTVDGIVSTGGEPNVIETVKVNGSALTPDASKAVDVTVPTNNNQLTNGAGYQTAAQVTSAIEAYGYSTNDGTVKSVTIKGTSPIVLDSESAITTSGTRTISHGASGVTAGTYKSVTVNATGHVTAGSNPTTLSGFGITDAYTKTETDSAISTAIGNITGISFEIVQSLPATGAAGTIYLISNSGTGTNVYDEYIYVNNAFEKIGTTDVDLSSYYNTSNLTAITNAEIDTIVAA